MADPSALLVELPFSFERRVLHVAQPSSGGVAAYVRALSAFQSDSGWDVHVAMPVPPTSESVRFHLWAAQRDPLSGVPTEIARLRSIVDMVQPDVVVLHSAKAGFVGRLAIRGNIPTVYVPHAWSFLALPASLAGQAMLWEKFASRWTNLVIAVSEGEARIGVARGVSAPMLVIANPVPVDPLSLDMVDPQTARARLGLPEAPTVVSVGRLCEQKGQDLLLRAWKLVQRNQPGARLVLVGEGPDREKLTRAADDSVTFTGNQPNVVDWLQAAEVVAMPSRWEGMALAMLEALAAGRSVVTNQVPGADVVVRARAGAAVAVGDEHGFARALDQRLHRTELADQEGARGARYVADHHAPKVSFTAVSAACVRAHAFGAPAGKGPS